MKKNQKQIAAIAVAGAAAYFLLRKTQTTPDVGIVAPAQITPADVKTVWAGISDTTGSLAPKLVTNYPASTAWTPYGPVIPTPPEGVPGPTTSTVLPSGEVVPVVPAGYIRNVRGKIVKIPDQFLVPGKELPPKFLARFLK